MTAAYRLKGIGWFGSCVAVVLGFYLVSLQVAAERKKLDDVNARIRTAERDIRALETEFDTRANLVQLEKWNGDTLALTAPVAGQFVGDEAQLASLDVTRGPAAGAVQTAALLVPAQSVPVTQPVVTTAAPAQLAPAQLAPAKPVAPASVVRLAKVELPQPQVVKAVAERIVAPKAAKTAPIATVRTAAAVAKVRPQAVAMLDRQLLSDTTLGDILKGAKTESRRRH
ncbi:hypothetical protein [Sphingomonas sp. SORGH_AS_0879]|uniref:hypothetical protein n=1 Tax=Sphingomonas sp. SORGH_AS_0879 TaxID=3041790 RepID=UPI00278A042A|nr:hypothetical protein [Sphingomonas sp. SORGH_AS_0879]MDQ1230068.1 hypothetical protein [Sphingomonas sp. SORGH_AS_0879]